MLRLLLTHLLVLIVVCTPLHAAKSSYHSVLSKHSLNELYDVSLFLSRAGFGGSLDDIDEIATLGEKKWLKLQMNLSPSYHAAHAIDQYNRYCESLNVPDCEKEEFLWKPLFRRFTLWDRVVNAPDQLAQKVAYALSQIFVVSEAQDELEDLEALSHWWDTLLQMG